MANPTMEPFAVMRKQLEEAEPDLLRDLLYGIVQGLTAADVDGLAGAGFGERTPERTNRRNGYRERRFDTRVGTIDLRIPKLRAGTYFPDWLLEPRRRSERALAAVVAEAYVLAVSTRRVERLVETLGITGISKCQVSELAKSLDEAVAGFRGRLDSGRYRHIQADALALTGPCGWPDRPSRGPGRDRGEPRRPARDPGPRGGHRQGRRIVAGAPCAVWWRVGSQACCSSRVRLMKDSRPRSPRHYRVRPGSAAGPTSCATC